MSEPKGMKWHKRYIQLAQLIASWSKDPSSKVGSVAVRDGSVLSLGYNGFNRGITSVNEEDCSREDKYKFVIHAEENVICNAAGNRVTLEGATIYVSGLPPCERCVRLLVQCRIKMIVAYETEYWHTRKDWMDSWDLSQRILNECSVKVLVIKESECQKTP